MAALNKITIERNQKTLAELVSQPGNDICADCKARNPRWASYNLGIFICVNCASIHRKIGTHITKVKSITMDAWTKEQVEPMKSIGNIKSNAMYNPNEARNPPPANLMDAGRDGELEQYIRSKYEFKRFINKSALVASKLGPSRISASAVSNGSVSNGSSQAAVTSLTSAVSSPSVSTQSSQSMAPRRSTLATTVPPQVLPQPSTLQPPLNPEAHNVTSSTNGNGVWTDLVSLQSSSSSSSLPLQYQAQSQLPPNVNPEGYQTSMVTGVNPFQQQHLVSNPYSQQLYVNSGLPGPSLSPGTTLSTSNFLGSSQQQSFSSAPQPLISAPAVQAQNNGAFVQPQPQQLSTAGQAIFVTDNGQSDFMSAPTTQGQFLSSSPAQFPSQSPVSTTPQLNMFSTTPQPQMLSATPQSQTQSQMMFMTTPSQQFQMQQQGGLGVGSLQLQSQSPMMMGQASFGAGPPQLHVTTMQPSGQFGGAFQQQFSAGVFSSGQQWGPM
ncbi:hypothetical protein C0993_010057 [Termitomyces sp. T159_Od127]|nr:hypothetical protein C0993_010057 [Termitomyces sp. T159_Od127]